MDIRVKSGKIIHETKASQCEDRVTRMPSKFEDESGNNSKVTYDVAVSKSVQKLWREKTGRKAQLFDSSWSKDSQLDKMRLVAELDCEDLLEFLGNLELEVYPALISFVKQPDMHVAALLRRADYEEVPNEIGPTFRRVAHQRRNDYASVQLAGPIARAIYGNIPETSIHSLLRNQGRSNCILYDNTPEGLQAKHSEEMRNFQGQLIALESEQNSDLRVAVRCSSRIPKSLDNSRPAKSVMLANHHLNLGSYEQIDKVESQLQSPVSTKITSLENLIDAKNSELDYDLAILPTSGFLSDIERAIFVVAVAHKGILPVTEKPHTLGRYLATELVSLLEGIEWKRVAVDSLYRDIMAVHARRLALQHHDQVAGMGRMASMRGSAEVPRSTASVLLPTMRPELIRGAVLNVVLQTYRPLELILVIHGQIGAADGILAGLNLDGVACETLEVPRTEPLGAVCNLALEAASGDVITKMDDDDSYGPHHVQDMLIALRESGAQLAGKAAEFLYLEGLDITIQRHIQGKYSRSRRLAGGTLTARRGDLLTVGGFPPLASGVDQALIRRMEGEGAATYRAHGYEYVLHRRPGGHTWDASVDYFLRKAVREWPGLALDRAGFLPGDGNAD